MDAGRDPTGASDEAADTSADETTLADDDDWRVAEQYRVEPRGAQADEATIILHQDAPAGRPVRRFPPDVGPGLLAALIGVLLVVLLVPAGIWLASNTGDEDTTTATDTNTLDTTTQPPTTTAPPTTPAKTLPDVTGRTLADARALLEKAEYRVRFRRVPSDKPRGVVLRQVPKSGSEAAPDLVVVLTVSGGPQRTAVPELVGLRAGEAIEMLREAGLESRTRLVSSTEPEGTVLGQEPAAGTKVDRGSVVLLDVSKAAPTPPPPTEPATVRVPNLVGLAAADARVRLRGLGLRVTQQPVESPRPQGTVVGQSPGAGADLREGGIVTLRISTGPARVAVPDVVGLDELAARQTLESAGFQVQVVDEPTGEPTEDGVVLEQDPRAGTTRRRGDIVTITVARFG